MQFTPHSCVLVCLENGIWLLVMTCRYGTGTLTKVFVERIFQECLTYDGEVVSNRAL